MNFLNKKYTTLHASSPYSQSNSRSFLPSASTVRQGAPLLSNNNCEHHPNEVVRHLCLECVELLCAECIGQHLQLHRQANVIPKIQSIKHVKGEMEDKMQHITSLMAKTHPGQIDVQSIKKRSLQKIDDMRKDLVRAVDEWVSIMKTHLLANLGFQEMSKMKIEMEKLCDEVNMLKNALQNGSQPIIVKKVFQIDGEKLQQGYSNMFFKYRQMQRKSDFEFAINWKEIIKSFQTHINVKGKELILQQPQLEQEGQQQSSNPYIHNSIQHTSNNKSSENMKVYDLRQ